MADTELWAKRVAQWRRSGLTSPEFCEGKDFTPGGLRNMASVLGKRATAAPVRLARVVRAPSAVPRAIEEPVVLEVGAVRIQVRRGASLETLAMVLKALEQR